MYVELEAQKRAQNETPRWQPGRFKHRLIGEQIMADGSPAEVEVNKRMDAFVARFEARAHQLRAMAHREPAKIIRFPVERRDQGAERAAA